MDTAEMARLVLAEVQRAQDQDDADMLEMFVEVIRRNRPDAVPEDFDAERRPADPRPDADSTSVVPPDATDLE